MLKDSRLFRLQKKDYVYLFPICSLPFCLLPGPRLNLKLTLLALRTFILTAALTKSFHRPRFKAVGYKSPVLRERGSSEPLLLAYLILGLPLPVTDVPAPDRIKKFVKAPICWCLHDVRCLPHLLVRITLVIKGWPGVSTWA